MATKRRLYYDALPVSPASNVHIMCQNPRCLEGLYQNTYSATRGDYWYRSHEVIVCHECGQPMRLVRKVTLFVAA